MNRLYELRSESGLSLRKVQFFTGIDFSRLAVIEKNDCNIEQKTMNKLCLFFDVSPEYFMGGDGRIYYYNERGEKYYHFYEQLKNIIQKEMVVTEIIDNRIHRKLTCNGIEAINNYFIMLNKNISKRIKINNFLDELDELNDNEYSNAKELILNYFSLRDIKGGDSKKQR